MRRTIDITNFPDISRLVDDVLRTGEEVFLVRDHEPVAVLRPVRATAPPIKKARKQKDPLDDPIMKLAGIITDGEPTDIARYKDKYIADAIDHRGE